MLPVYLQVVLGLDAFETGKRLFPMSVTMFIAAMLGPKLAAGLAPKRVAQIGLIALAVASVILLGTIDVELNKPEFAIALALFGVGAGLLLSQLGNVIMSSVDPAKTNEAGGLQGTAQNLGASLGTALIGSVLIAALTNGLVDRVEQNPAVPEPRSASRSPRSPRRASRSCRSTRSSRRRVDAGRAARAGAGDRRRLRRRAAARPQAGDRRRRDLRAAVAVVHAGPSRQGQEPSFSRHDELSVSMALIVSPRLRHGQWGVRACGGVAGTTAVGMRTGWRPRARGGTLASYPFR